MKNFPRLGSILFATLAWLCAAPAGWPHPHVWIEARVIARFDSQGLAGYAVRWRFDELFSGSILADFDADRNRRLSPAESSLVELGAFANLARYNYFTFVREPGAEKKGVRQVEGFRASIDERGRLLYQFFVPWRLPFAAGAQTVGIAIYDESFFVDIRYAQQEPLRAEGRPLPDHAVQLAAIPASAYWGGTIIPNELRLRFGAKP